MDLLILRLDAPLMSFGAPIVDNRGAIEDHPPLSLLTGLLANALGYDHRQPERLLGLQRRIRYACRRDRTGERMTDFQTVDLGQDFLVDKGWTTRGAIERRAGGSAREGTHIRTRDYLADAVYTVALTLERRDEAPTLDDVATALDSPERPLFLGRKPCLPSAPLLLGRLEAVSLYAALQRAPRLHPERVDGDPDARAACWPDGDGPDDHGTALAVTDERDWTNQIHGGQRVVRHGYVNLTEVEHAG
jgi:CRISPR system Cascade subunit CasD